MKTLFSVLLLLIGLQANAGILTVDVSESELNIGDTFEVSINASGFGDVYFDFDLSFDDSLFSFDQSTLVSDLDLDPLTSFFVVSPQSDHIAFSDPFGFSGDALIARFTLTALSYVDSFAFSFTDVEFYDSFDFSLFPAPINTDASSVASVAVSEVPEPSHLVMLAFAAVLLLHRKRL